METLASIWKQYRPSMLEHLDVLERSVDRLLDGGLEEQQRIEARRAAHTLSGSVGTFGFARASRTASELERAFADITQAQPFALPPLIDVIRRELERETIPSLQGSTRDPSEQPRVLVVDDEGAFCAQIESEATALGIRCEIVSSPREARMVCHARAPSIVLLNLTLAPEESAEAYDLLAELSARTPPLPVLVRTRTDAFSDRVEVSRRGGRAFLAKSLSASETLDTAMRYLERERLERTKVLIVDDDPSVLAAMRALLESQDIDVSTLTEPLCFWETLEKTAPELLILDVDMLDVDGPELCRVVRSDSRWSQIAVIFVTAHKDPETIEGIFQSGADDYLAKPIIGRELITRVSNRLERVRLHRMRADTDELTGLPSRAKSSEDLVKLISLAERFAQPVSVTMLDLDHFKTINDRHGHAVGDMVLRRLGQRLRRDFRGNDVVGRWGGEEFLIGMYGMACADGARRLTATLKSFSNEQFTVGPIRFSTSFSAGVAEYPIDGKDLVTVLKAADDALYLAKAAGRKSVLSAQNSELREGGP